MKISRRQFVKGAAILGAATAFPLRFTVLDAEAFYQSPKIPKFSVPLRGVGGATGIPVAVSDGIAATGAKHYTIEINQFQDQLLPAPAFGPTTLWGYHPTKCLGDPVGGRLPQKALGGIIVTQMNQPVQITFRNNLPNAHVVPVDMTLPDIQMNPEQNKVSVHLHGGFTLWMFDGMPEAWWIPSGKHGMSFINNLLNPTAAVNEAEYYYGNEQSARFLWYHDHARDLTRLNAYAGIATGYIIRDNVELMLTDPTPGNIHYSALPAFVENGGAREIPLIFTEKIFIDAKTIAAKDPTWPAYCPRTTGSIWYPHVYEKARWMAQKPVRYLPHPSCIPEFFGDTMLVNGVPFPTVQVDAAAYRFRILNACQSRFLNLQLYVADASPDGITLGANGNPTNAAGPAFTVIGTEGGFLPAPITVAPNTPFDPLNPFAYDNCLMTAPAERWDLIIDFNAYANKTLILYNDAPAPFPVGDPLNDYRTAAATGPDTRVLMQFVVKGVPADYVPFNAVQMATTLQTPGISNPLDGGIGDYDLFTRFDAYLQNLTPTTNPRALVKMFPQELSLRQLTLNETFDKSGRLLQMLGTNQIAAFNTKIYSGRGYSMPYEAPPTETPKQGAIEIWEVANLSGDTHPIHIHLVNFRVLGRQAFDPRSYRRGSLLFTGQFYAPPAHEAGWKETVKMNPGEVTWIIMQFNLPKDVPGISPTPPSPRTGGHEYVWHCHILEHEEHDMMRPLVVI